MGFGQVGSDSGSLPSGGDFGVFGTSGGASGIPRNVPCGVWGDSGDGNGVVGQSGNGVGVGGGSPGGIGVSGRSDSGVGVEALSNSGTGLHAVAVAGGQAAVFDGDAVHNGNLTVTGIAALNIANVSSVLTVNTVVASSFSSNAKLFRIDHPVDPSNKYLCHSSVESPDMKNVYDGVSALDGQGGVVVELPAWFEALNRDFRYQLTPIGAPGPNLYVAQEIQGNRFAIAGGRPGTKVSWQVTGVRHDAYAEAHRVQVEQEKPEAERGYYLHPELFGEPAEKGMEAARQAERMRRRKDLERGTTPSLEAQPVAGDASPLGSQALGVL